MDRWSEPAAAAWLFGSAARGNRGPEGDIDVLVLRPDAVDGGAPEWLGRLDTLASEVTAWTGNPCAVSEYSESEFAALVSTGESLVDELRSDTLRISGDRVEDRCRKQAS